MFVIQVKLRAQSTSLSVSHDESDVDGSFTSDGDELFFVHCW